MLKIFSAVILVMSLSGCFYQKVDSYDIHRVIKVCGSIEDVMYINAHAVGDEYVTCKNGKEGHLGTNYERYDR